MGEHDLGANLFSSVSGTVEKVTQEEIVIRADEVQTTEYQKLKSEKPLDLIREAGIVGLGGAGFPTYVKLGRPFEHGGTVIVNAAECEPILGHNIAAIEKNPAQLIRGLEIVMEVVHAAKGIIAIKEIHRQAVCQMRAWRYVFSPICIRWARSAQS
jgi:Na+-translocating ferredoxin:NAD+ oxidoreductase RnfC subunit